MHDDLPRVKHEPIAPSRPCTPGEGIYLGLWQEWATAHPREWSRIFTTCDRLGQRTASVAASFMVFMGCNGGQSFTDLALRMAETIRSRERAFLAAWAIENQRCRGINHGLRTIEYMLAPEHPISDQKPFGRGIDWPKVPAITMHDIDIVESMVGWWAGITAETIRSVAEPMIEAAKRKRLAGIFDRQGDRHG